MVNRKEAGPETKAVKFEDALKRLEKIVEDLEAGDAPLEQSLALYDFYTEKISACDTQIEQNYAVQNGQALMVENKSTSKTPLFMTLSGLSYLPSFKSTETPAADTIPSNCLVIPYGFVSIVIG